MNLESLEISISLVADHLATLDHYISRHQKMPQSNKKPALNIADIGIGASSSRDTIVSIYGKEGTIDLSVDTVSSSSGGWKSGDPKFQDPGNGSGSAGKGDGDGVGNGAKQGKVKTPPAGNYYLTVGSQGVWQEDAANANGLLDNGETLITGTGLSDADSDGFFTLVGIDIATDNVTVRFVDGRTTTPLDLTGFATGDKLILDGNTNLGSLYNFKGTISSALGKIAPLTSAFTGNKYVGVSGFVNYLSYVSAQIYVALSKVRGIYYATNYTAKLTTSAGFTMAKGLSGPSSYAFEAIMPVI